MSLDPEARPEHTHRVSHIVTHHGVADTTDAQLAAAMAKAELECRTCEGLGFCNPCPVCCGTGVEP